MTKVCCTCRAAKPIAEFHANRHKRYKDGLNPQCKTCRRAYTATKAWRDAHREQHRTYQNTYREAKYKVNKKRAMALLGSKCAFCGVAYNGKNAPIFEFDHINPIEKEELVSNLLIDAKWDRAEREIKKCQLLCANCHNVRHCGEW